MVEIRAGGRIWRRRIVNRDSCRSQHGSSLHFGLGGASGTCFIEIRWPGGYRARPDSPALDSWQEIEPPPQEEPASKR